MIKMIISGGQTGADVAGLFAAKKADVQTGGWAPKGYRTENGPSPWLKDYGLHQTQSSGYKVRTRRNVTLSDGTVWFGDQTSAGGKLTLRLCKELGKPVFKVPYDGDFMARPDRDPAWIWVRRLVRWAKTYDIEMLNVAGNRESVTPTITVFAEGIITYLIKYCNTEDEQYVPEKKARKEKKALKRNR